MQILIVGGGNMGQSYARSFLKGHLVHQKDLFILEHLPEKMDALQKQGFENTWLTPDASIRQLDLVVLAVKPQDRFSMYDKLKGYLTESHVLLSIMAGVTMKEIADTLGTPKVVRAMPNLPAQNGTGMTGYSSTDEVNRKELTFVQNLLNTTGKSIYFDKESRLDEVTAISGSGPAYVFYFMQAMIDKAIQMGFTQAEAELMVEQTFRGSLQLFKQNSFSCQEWMQKVASRGGTTEAALLSFDQSNINQKIGEGLQAAANRASELGLK